MKNPLDSRFIETSEAIVSQFGYEDLKSFVKKQALLIVLSKMEKYRTENKRFETKYAMDFESFREKIESLENEEVFSAADDYLDWRFAEEALNRLKRQKRELENA